MLKVWGRVNSVNVKKTMWCVAELGLPHERIDAGMQFGVVNTPEYRKMNPTGLVPTINDDGFVLWESHSIGATRAKNSMANLPPTCRARRRRAGGWPSPSRSRCATGRGMIRRAENRPDGNRGRHEEEP